MISKTMMRYLGQEMKEIDYKVILKIQRFSQKKKKKDIIHIPKVISSIERLSNAGISENDIIAIDRIVSMSGTTHNLYKDKRRFKQNLIDDLQKYGNLKLAIKNLQDKKKINLKTHEKGQPQSQKQKNEKNKSSTSKDIK